MNKVKMVSCGSLLICLVLAAGVAAAPKDRKSEDDIETQNPQLADSSHVDYSGDIPVVMAHIKDEQNNEYEFRAPFFDANEQLSPLEIKEFHDEVISKVLKPAGQIIDSALIKGLQKFFLTPQLGAIGVKIFFMHMANQKKSKELKKKYTRPHDTRFQQEAMELLPGLIKKAKEEMKQAGKKDSKKYEDKNARKETGRRIMLILEGIKQLVLNSPVGTHLDFKNVTINGELMIEEAVEHIKFMNKSGLGWIVDVINGQCNKITDQQKMAEEKTAEITSAEEAANP